MTTWIDCPSDDSFALQAADHIATLIRIAIDRKGRCIIGLSGGSTPGPVYEALGNEAGIDWSRVTIFLIDERCVPETHEESNARLTRSTLLLHADIPEANIIFPDTTLNPATCAADYAARLEAILGDGADVIVLGMGPDGHTASLFPPLSESALGPAIAIHTTTDTFAVRDRISVTLPVLRDAQHTVFLIKGDDKKRTWDEMTASDEDAYRWPAKELLKKDVTVFHRSA